MNKKRGAKKKSQMKIPRNSPEAIAQGLERAADKLDRIAKNDILPRRDANRCTKNAMHARDFAALVRSGGLATERAVLSRQVANEIVELNRLLIALHRGRQKNAKPRD